MPKPIQSVLRGFRVLQVPHYKTHSAVETSHTRASPEAKTSSETTAAVVQNRLPQGSDSHVAPVVHNFLN